MTPAAFIKFALPHIYTCSLYAKKLQGQIKALPAKGGDSLFAQALSHADLSIQNYLEVCLLSHYPDIAFYGEEEESSYNVEYFPKDAELCITADPIDGTRLFLDGSTKFNIVLSLLKDNVMQAAICALPATGDCYFATSELGAFHVVLNDDLLFESWTPFSITSSSQTILTHNDAELLSKLSDLDAFDIAEKYTADSKQWDYSLSSILSGEMGAYVSSEGHVIDWGAIGFIASHAGGAMTDFAGKPITTFSPPSYRASGLIVASSPEVQAQILDCL